MCVVGLGFLQPIRSEFLWGGGGVQGPSGPDLPIFLPRDRVGDGWGVGGGVLLPGGRGD